MLRSSQAHFFPVVLTIPVVFAFMAPSTDEPRDIFSNRALLRASTFEFKPLKSRPNCTARRQVLNKVGISRVNNAFEKAEIPFDDPQESFNPSLFPLFWFSGNDLFGVKA